jgi:acetyl esterase/lipase
MTNRRRRRWVLAAAGLLAAGLLWLATTEQHAVWPVRNTLQYQALRWWWGLAGVPHAGYEPGALAGAVTTRGGQPIAGATVLVATWDGTTYSATTAADGRYRIADVPEGRYVPIAGAPGYAAQAVRPWGLRVRVLPDSERRLDITLEAEKAPVVAPGTGFVLGEAEELSCPGPVASRALRREVRFESGGRASQPAFYYEPISGTERLPTVLAIYPGPADSWECASLPLTQAGYAVLASGPAYALDLEHDIDELERLLQFVRAGRFARADAERVAVVAGSYSGLHVQRLVQRGVELRAALLLGPPTDLFDMRQRLEERSFVPPFGLDAALVALGLPDRNPERYFRYSGRYHVSERWPVVALLHSRTDSVVPFQQSELLAAKLEALGVPYESYFFEGASHYLLGAEGQGEVEDTLEVYRITLDFLARQLR